MGEMDSSGSMQSSSTGGVGGGDGGCDEQEELDSRGKPMSNFFNPTQYQLYSCNNSNGSLSFDNSHNHQAGGYNFDPTTLTQSSAGNFIINNATSNNNNNNKNSNDITNNLDMVWPNKFGSIRSTIISSHDANCTTSPYGFSLNNFNHTLAPVPALNEVSLQQQRPPPLPLPTTRAPSVSAENSPRASDLQGGGGGGGGGRNPKKRSRASRRAPTTVLTTDTTNFRQMVQEFTGIPAPPFSASSAFQSRTRLGLFGGLGIQLPRSGGFSAGLDVDMSNSHPYLLRPFPQKALPHQLTPNAASNLVQPFFLGSSTPSSLPSGALAGASMNSTFNHFSDTPTTAELRPQNVMSGAQTPMQTLQTLLQQGSTTSDVKSNDAETLIMREYGLSHAATAITMTTSTTPATSLGVQNWSALNQSSCIGLNTSTSVVAESVDEVLSSGNHGGVSRGEGMVDSWICSSD